MCGHRRLAVVVDDRRSRRRVSTPAASRPRPSELGIDPMASSAWRARATAPVVAAHATTPSSVEVDAGGPGALEQAHTPLEEVVLERGGHLGVLLGQHLLAADDERDLAAERREHVDELDAGDAGADRPPGARAARAAGRRRGWSGPARRRRRPSRGCGGGCRWTAARRRPRSRLGPVGGLGDDRRGADEAPRALDHAHALALEQLGHGALEALPRCCAMRSRRAVEVERRPRRPGGPCRRPCRCGRGRRRWRSWPWTGCSPTGGRPRRRCRARSG